MTEWRTLFDETYETETSKEPTFVGWNSSYANAPNSQSEMREWLDCVVDRIVSLKPNRVLEIGCGVGLLAQRLAPACQVYRGTDISKAAISKLQYWLKTQPKLGHVEIVQQHANNFKDLTSAQPIP